MAASAASTSAFAPPARYGLIEPGLYRSAFPTPDNFGHLRLLGLRTVVNLSQEALTRAASVFLAENGILLADVGLQVWTHPKCEPISHELIKEAMRFVLDRAHHPLLVVSASGTHQVGALVGCLRRLQRWTLAATLAEYRLYAAPSPRLAVEQFIELWDCDLLTLPADVPSWFARQLEMLEDDRELLARMVAEEGASSLSGSYQGAARSSVGGGSLSRGASNLASPLQAPAASVSAPAPLPLPAAISDGVLPDASPSAADAPMALEPEDEAAIEAIAGAAYYGDATSAAQYFDVKGLLAPPGTKTSIIDPRDD